VSLCHVYIPLSRPNGAYIVTFPIQELTACREAEHALTMQALASYLSIMLLGCQLQNEKDESANGFNTALIQILQQLYTSAPHVQILITHWQEGGYHGKTHGNARYYFLGNQINMG
jgi:hypothetical protein